MTLPLVSLPGPRGLPFVGSLGAVAGDPLGFFTDVARTHGGLAHFRIGAQPTLLVTDPALVEAVLVEHRADTGKDPITASLSAVVGTGLLTAEGEAWRARRKQMAPSFQPKELAAMAATMRTLAEARVATFGDGVRDVHVDTMALTLDIAVRTLFGATLDDGGAVGPLVESLMAAFNRRVHSWQRLLPSWVPTPARREIAAANVTLRARLRDLVAERRTAPGDDLLGRLLALRDDDGHGLDDEALLDEVVTLFLAGHETTALALGYTLDLLGRHPDARRRVHDELAADVPRLPYLDACVTEAMRLYPPAWIIGRSALREFELGDVCVPAGTVLLLPQWVVHRDPALFPDPDTFRPERWLEPVERPKFAYFPFGGGPRVCIGNHFAKMETLTVLAAWLREVDVEAEGPPPALLPSVTLRPKHGIPLRVRRREGRRAAA